jgi:hypothetical protein
MDEVIFDLCRSALIRRFVDSCLARFSGPADDANNRRPLSFHAVSFGQDPSTASLRRMAQIALEVQNNAPHDPLLPAVANVPSSYTEALDTVS